MESWNKTAGVLTQSAARSSLPDRTCSAVPRSINWLLVSPHDQRLAGAGAEAAEATRSTSAFISQEVMPKNFTCLPWHGLAAALWFPRSTTQLLEGWSRRFTRGWLCTLHQQTLHTQQKAGRRRQAATHRYRPWCSSWSTLSPGSSRRKIGDLLQKSSQKKL